MTFLKTADSDQQCAKARWHNATGFRSHSAATFDALECGKDGDRPPLLPCTPWECYCDCWICEDWLQGLPQRMPRCWFEHWLKVLITYEAFGKTYHILLASHIDEQSSRGFVFCCGATSVKSSPPFSYCIMHHLGQAPCQFFVAVGHRLTRRAFE